MFKTAASLTVGCALLSTSAFAALEGTVVPTETGATVSLTGYAEKAQSTILVLKDVEELSADIADSAIAYINQAEATDGTITYDVKVSGDGTYSVFVGGSDQTEAKKLESFVISSVPANDYITSADTDKGTIKIDVASVTDASMGAAAGNAIVSLALDTTAYPAAGQKTAGYVVKVVNADGSDIEGAVVYYSAERAKYVALVPTTVSDYKFEVIAADAEGAVANAVIAKYGNMNEDAAGSINAPDLLQFRKIVKKTADAASVTDAKKALIADISGDGKVNAPDLLQFRKAIKKQDYTFAVLNK